MMQSALYHMTVSHHRLHPQKHRLRMRVTYLLLDLDELPALSHSRRWFSAARGNLVSFRESDHGDGAIGGLRNWVNMQLLEAGIVPPGGAIRLLCMPRLLGHAFNPLSVYFCHSAAGDLRAMLYEVRNTFRQRHNYAVAVADDQPRFRHSATKRFYVSPFMPMEMSYRFDIQRSDERLRIAITGGAADRSFIHAVMAGDRHEITDAALLGAALRMPLQGLQVVARIYWEGLKLWWKGAAFHHRPAPPTQTVSRGV